MRPNRFSFNLLGLLHLLSRFRSKPNRSEEDLLGYYSPRLIYKGHYINNPGHLIAN